MIRPDLIATHVAELAAALRGPAGPRRSMIVETRHGLQDAAEGYRKGGLDPEQAAARAVRDFGSVADIAPPYQMELAVRQGRRTSLLLALAFPGLMLSWNVLWSSGVVWTGPAPALVAAMASAQDVASVVVAAAALVLFLATFRATTCDDPLSPRRLTATVGWVGVAGALAVGGTAVAMNVANGAATTDVLTTSATADVAYTVSATVIAIVIVSVVRTLRLVRA